MKVWLDDIRPVPWLAVEDGFVPFRCAEGLIPHIEAGEVEEISFDHDLGEGRMTGYDVAKRIEALAEAGTIPPISYRVHSGNVVGAMNIEMAMESAWRFWGKRRNK
jgi:hypothetical protein